MRTLKHWVQADHLKMFKLVITSRPEGAITKMFPEFTTTHVDIPSGSDVKLEDSVERTWITNALDYLVSRTNGIFIWATTAAEFL